MGFGELPVDIQGEWYIQRKQGISHPFTIHGPMHFFHLAVPDLYCFIINQ